MVDLDFGQQRRPAPLTDLIFCYIKMNMDNDADTLKNIDL